MRRLVARVLVVRGVSGHLLFDGLHGASHNKLEIPSIIQHFNDSMVVTHGSLQPARGRCALTIGNFDGVHLGHRALIDRVVAAARFIEDVLVKDLRTAWLLVGRDFRFGAQRKGDFAALQGHGFALEAMPDVALDSERVSSSAVRAALTAGDFARVERLLGRPYTLSGRVTHGAKLGHDLGFPTANIALRQRPPLGGIYVVEVENMGPGVASVGVRPTVNPVPKPLLEVHLLERGGNLYGRRLRVRFLSKLRDEAKFEGLAALRAAIAQDAEQARRYFASHG